MHPPPATSDHTGVELHLGSHRRRVSREVRACTRNPRSARSFPRGWLLCGQEVR
ncbi:hypothetical protein APASM_0047 [Actinosynnema pretiosum subsp. pretiosum]|nr:hypothetical protein APASM_0047 [Actinosynnema pretiosum subsp. pretiosum]